jgi:hypothetical protein
MVWQLSHLPVTFAMAGPEKSATSTAVASLMVKAKIVFFILHSSFRNLIFTPTFETLSF